MNFSEIAKTRQSCRLYDKTKQVEDEKIKGVIIEDMNKERSSLWN